MLAFFWLATVAGLAYLVIASKSLGGIWASVLMIAGLMIGSNLWSNIEGKSYFQELNLSRDRLVLWLLISLSWAVAFMFLMKFFGNASTSSLLASYVDGFFTGLSIPLLIVVGLGLVVEILTLFTGGWMITIALGITLLLIALILPVALPTLGAEWLIRKLPIMSQYYSVIQQGGASKGGMYAFGILCGLGYFINFAKETLDYLIGIAKGYKRQLGKFKSRLPSFGGE